MIFPRYLEFNKKVIWSSTKEFLHSCIGSKVDLCGDDIVKSLDGPRQLKLHFARVGLELRQGYAHEDPRRVGPVCECERECV